MASPSKTKPKTASSVKPAEADFQQASDARRVKDVAGARSIFNRFIQDNVLRSNTIANTRNQLEGGRPFNPSELEAQGSAWQTNVNFGDAQAARDRDFLPYWKMINDVPHRAEFEISSNSTDSDRWEVSFAEAFDEFHDDWGSDYFVQFMKGCKNFVDFGPMLVHHGAGDPDNPRYKAVNVQRVYFPKNTQISPDEWEVMAFVRDVSASELYQKIRDKNSSRQSSYAGWNINAIKAAIVQMKDGGQFPDYRDYTRYQDLLVNNDIVITSPFQPMTMVWLYVKNFDGKIGCYVFPQNQGVEEFLFEDDGYAESYRRIMGAVWYDTGTDGMVHSIKGFGIKNFFFSTLINRIKSRIVDGSTIAAGINFQYTSENIPEEAPPVENYGPFTIFPPGLTQLNVYPQLQQASGVLEILNNNRDQNNALYSEQKQQIENSDTATQAKILATMQGQLSEAQAAIFLSQVADNIYSEQVRRMRVKGNTNEDAKKFVERLREKGVPDEVIFKTPIRVKTGANAGMSNPAMMAQKFQEGLTLSSLPGVNQRWFLENVIAYKYGSQAINKALLPVGADSEPQQRRQAIMENADFGQGIQLPVAPEDAHFEHIQEHLKPLGGIVQNYNQKQVVSPEQLSALTIGIEHAGEHMQYLAKDETKKDQIQAVLGPFRQIQSTVRGILTRMQSQAQNPGQSPVQGGGGQPQQPPPPNGGKPVSESISISYKDLQPDVQDQVLQQIGLQPSQMRPVMQPAQK